MKFRNVGLLGIVGVILLIGIIMSNLNIPPYVLPRPGQTSGRNGSEGFAAEAAYHGFHSIFVWMYRETWILDEGKISIKHTVFLNSIPVWSNRYYQDRCVDGLQLRHEESVRYGLPFHTMIYESCK